MSRFFLFLLSTGVFFALALMIPLTSGMLLIPPPLLALASTALVSHIFSQKKRMDALEKEVAELLGMDLDSFHSMLYRARKWIKDNYEHRLDEIREL